MNLALEIFFTAKKCIFYDLNINEVLYQVSHATDQKRHLVLIRFRIFKIRWASVANDHLGTKPLISDSATRMSLWPLQCQPVALDDNEWQISKTLIQSSIQTHGHVSKKSYFGIWHFWKSYSWLRPIWGLDHRSRSRNRSRRSRYILPGAGAAEQFYSEPEPECFPGARAGAGADQKCHGSASLLLAPLLFLLFINDVPCEVDSSRENQGNQSDQSRITLIVIWVKVESTGYSFSQKVESRIFLKRKR